MLAICLKRNGDFVRAGRHDFTFVNGDELVSVFLQEFRTHLEKGGVFSVPFAVIGHRQTEFRGWQYIDLVHGRILLARQLFRTTNSGFTSV